MYAPMMSRQHVSTDDIRLLLQQAVSPCVHHGTCCDAFFHHELSSVCAFSFCLPAAQALLGLSHAQVLTNNVLMLCLIWYIPSRPASWPSRLSCHGISRDTHTGLVKPPHQTWMQPRTSPRHVTILSESLSGMHQFYDDLDDPIYS